MGDVGDKGDAGLGSYAGFVRERYAALTRTAFLLVGDRGHAEDLVQTALGSTYAAWERLADPDTGQAYTRVTMVRLAGRWRRRRWRGELPTGTLPDRPMAEADPATAMDVRRALGRLPFEQRAVLVLRYFEDLSERDTAKVLGCSVGTVKSRNARALAALRYTGLLDTQEVGHG